MDTNRLKEILENLKKLLSEVDLAEIDDKDLFHEAVNIYIHENISTERKQQQTSGNLATEKQIQYLKTEKVKIPEGLTKTEASKLISEIIERKKKSKKDDDY